MYCTLCGLEKKNNMDLLGIKLCKACMEDMSTTPVFDEKYDYYKEIIKLILKSYIYERNKLNPVN